MALRLQTGVRVFVLATTVWVAAGLGQADARDHDAARRAVETGEIRPLADILNDLRDKLPGEIVGIEIEQENGRWFYELRTVDSKGHLFEVYIDARSGRIERVKGK